MCYYCVLVRNCLFLKLHLKLLVIGLVKSSVYPNLRRQHSLHIVWVGCENRFCPISKRLAVDCFATVSALNLNLMRQ